MALSDPSSAVIKARQPLPDDLTSVKSNYEKFWFHYFCNPTAILFFALILAVTGALLVQLTGLKLYTLSELWSNPMVQLYIATRLTGSVLLLFLLGLYLGKRYRPVYLVDFTCSLPENERKISVDSFIKMTEGFGVFSSESVQFQRRISKRSGLGDKTYLPRSITSRPPKLSMCEARAEAESVMFGALDSLFKKTGVRPADIGVLVACCSLFNPAPSLTAVIVNHYKMREDIKSFNLTGMGCSAGLIAVDLAKDFLKSNPNSYAIVVSTENITQNWYFGSDRSMLLSNCIFRMGAAALLLSNHRRERSRSKYELVHLVRTDTGADDRSYYCVYQGEDENGTVGVSLGRELMAAAGDALKANIKTLGPLVLPLSEQLIFFVTRIKRKFFKLDVKPYIPDFKLAFEHFCVHSGGRAVLDGVQKNLNLTDWHLEPSRMTLHRFGNISSSSVWYELAYTEAIGRVAIGDRIWQIAFGSGYTCNSAFWRALRNISPAGEMEGNAWTGSIENYPVQVNLG